MHVIKGSGDETRDDRMNPYRTDTDSDRIYFQLIWKIRSMTTVHLTCYLYVYKIE
jgi:hypothetical protein